MRATRLPWYTIPHPRCCLRTRPRSATSGKRPFIPSSWAPAIPGKSWKSTRRRRWQSSFQDFTANLVTGTQQPETVPNYITLNLRVAYRINDNATISALAEQLNQQTIVETSGLQVDRRLIAGVEVKF